MHIDITIEAKQSLTPREAQLLQAVLHAYKTVLLQSIALEKILDAVSRRSDKSSKGPVDDAVLYANAAEDLRRFAQGYFPDLGFKVEVRDPKKKA